MKRRSMNRITVPAALLFFSSIPIAIAMVELVQIPTGTLPEDSAHLRITPIPHFLHVLAGVLFGILGPIQFGRVLAKKYGKVHRVMGRVFVASAAFLSLSSLSLLWTFRDGGMDLISGSRIVFAIAMGITLVVAMQAVRARNFDKHRDWMIRTYAIGIGGTAVSFVMFPIYIITGEPPSGLTSDLIFVGAWIVSIAVGEWVIARINRPRLATA